MPKKSTVIASEAKGPAPKRPWRAFVLGAPAGAWFLVLAVPGPCTTFNGVGSPTTSTDSASQDGEPGDSSAMQDCGLTFDFGPTSADGCAELATNCCQLIEICASQTQDAGCKDWVECVNRCPVPREGGCVARCGNEPQTVVDLAKCFYGLVDGSSACYWPFEDGGRG